MLPWRSPAEEVRFLRRMGHESTETKSDVKPRAPLTRRARVSERGQAFWGLAQWCLLSPVLLKVVESGRAVTCLPLQIIPPPPHLSLTLPTPGHSTHSRPGEEPQCHPRVLRSPGPCPPRLQPSSQEENQCCLWGRRREVPIGRNPGEWAEQSGETEGAGEGDSAGRGG